MKKTVRRPLSRALLCFLAPILLVAMGALPDAGCSGDRPEVRGSGTVVTEDRAVDDLHGVEVRNQGNLVVTFGPETSLTVEAEDNLLEHLATEVRDGILYFDTVPGGTNLRNRKAIVYRLTVPNLSALSASSAGNITVPAMEVDRLTVYVSSAGNVEIEALVAHALKANLSSAGNLTIGSGAVIDQHVSVSSAGDYEAEGLSSERATVHLSSAGDARVQVNEYLEASVSSVGSLYYRGDPELDADTSSMGKVVHLND